jgi:hypothetical protein
MIFFKLQKTHWDFHAAMIDDSKKKTEQLLMSVGFSHVGYGVNLF